MSVSTEPGSITLILMCRSITSLRSVSAKASTPALLAA
jgi:hypothetical protein